MAVPGPAGLVRRMGRIFDQKTGVAIIVAMDHGITGVPSGFENPRSLFKTVLNSRPDGVLLNAGMARRCLDLMVGRDTPALVLALDQVIHKLPRRTGSGVAHTRQISVNEAVRLGADCVKTMILMGDPDRRQTIENLAYIAQVAEECRIFEMPLMIEPYLWGEDVPKDPACRAELNADGCRMAVELGADIVKTEYCGDPKRFREIVASSPVPVVILGGPKRHTQREVLADVVASAEAGALGLTIGRNVWEHPDPQKMTKALTVAMASRDLDAALRELV